MKAIILTKSGAPDVLQLRVIDKPTPKENEVLIKIFGASVTRGDVIMRKLPLVAKLVFSIFGFTRKKISGYELAGEIEAVGKKVTQFKPGDQVYGTTSGVSSGSNAQYICLPEKSKRGVLSLKPDNLSFEEAAVVPVGGMTALHLLRKVNIQKGQKILIYGASGSVGTYAVQLAKYFGGEVTGVCSNANVVMVKSIGADRVIDYNKEEFTKNGEKYDVIFDTVRKISDATCKNSFTQGGQFLSVKSSTTEEVEKLNFLKELIEKGKIKPLIDRRYPLEQTAEAHRYVEKGHKKGNVVIQVEHSE